MKNLIILFFYIQIFLLVFVINSCSGCSKSGLLESKTNSNYHHRNVNITPSGKTVVKMEKYDGVYHIPAEINGVEMSFIFDTGAGLISISATEVAFLYKQGKLTDEDFIGTASFIDANGDISEGTIINLKTVKIGDRTIYDVEASVVYNLVAPLLFGQSALEKFGKISIDYSRNEIAFE